MIKETDWKNVHILGRTIPEEGCLPMEWTASGVEFEINCSEFGACFEAGSNIYMPWISVIFDGYPITHMPVQDGEHEYIFFRGLDPSIKHHVRISKDFQPIPGDATCFLNLKYIIHDGSISKPADKKLKIEFIGDSITSGEGALGDRDEIDWISPYFSSVENYAVMTADELDADFRLISQSGCGVLSAWDNNPNGILGNVYDSTLAEYDDRSYDHSSWKPDVIVINLGTNDEGSFTNPAFTDPKTGKVYKNKKLPDGSYDPDDVRRFQLSVIEFLKHVREVNPGSYILWVYGMLGFAFSEIIEDAVNEYKSSTKDDNAAYMLLPETTWETFGSRGHPGPLSHKNASEVLIKHLKGILNK